MKEKIIPGGIVGAMGPGGLKPPRQNKIGNYVIFRVGDRAPTFFHEKEIDCLIEVRRLAMLLENAGSEFYICKVEAKIISKIEIVIEE